MKCMNCGAELGDSIYCPSCGKDISVQKQAVFLSEFYYNEGLEKAEVRDLSGATESLKKSLKFNKLNINARNLLGLVYFEVGEVVAALSEWVISKNIQPVNNPAEAYISDLRKNSGKLDEINETIKKFNIALGNCRDDNEDVAEIQLKKILTKNPKLIKGYHLLSLLYIKKGDFERARRLLVKAIRIDRTNTTTLRFLKEIEEQTGKATESEKSFRFGNSRSGNRNRGKNDRVMIQENDEGVIEPASYKETNHMGTFWSIALGILIGAAVVGFLIMPARVASINRQANETITKYSSDAASKTAEIARLNEEIEASAASVENANSTVETTEKRAESYRYLLQAVVAYNAGRSNDTVDNLIQVDKTLLSEEALETYNSIRNEFPDSMFEGVDGVPITPSSVDGEDAEGSDAGSSDNGEGETSSEEEMQGASEDQENYE